MSDRVPKMDQNKRPATVKISAFTQRGLQRRPSGGWVTASILAGWLAFGGSHLYLSSEPRRSRLIEKYGKEKFQAGYTLISFMTIGPLSLVALRYGKRFPGPRLWNGSAALPRVTGKILHIAGFFILAQAVVDPSDFSLAKQMEKEQKEKQQEEATKEDGVSAVAMVAKEDAESIDAQIYGRGIHRVSRHPFFTGLSTVTLGSLLRHGHLNPVLYFIGFPIFTMLGCIHQDQRLLRNSENPEITRQFLEHTSILPFGAFLAGKNSFNSALREMNTTAAISSYAAAMVLLLFP